MKKEENRFCFINLCIVNICCDGTSTKTKLWFYGWIEVIT